MKSKTLSRREAAVGGVAVLAAATASASDVSVKRINPKELPPSRGYTQVVTASGGRTVYISGQVAMNAKGEIVGKGDLKAQAVQVFENLKIALAASGAGPKDVVKMSIFVVNFKGADDVAVVRDVRNGFFANVDPPASTFLGISALANPDWMLEIEAIAVVA